MTYSGESLLYEISCRGKHAMQIYEAIMVRNCTVLQLAHVIHRGVRYTHDLVRCLEAEGRVTLGEAERVSDRSVSIDWDAYLKDDE